jgi:hypothetical protein
MFSGMVLYQRRWKWRKKSWWFYKRHWWSLGIHRNN